MIDCASFVNSFYSSVSYIIRAVDSDIAWVIDPGDISPILDYLSTNGLIVSGILLTHCHYDHIYGVNELMSQNGDCRIYTNRYGRSMLNDPKLNLSKYHDSPYRIQNIESICEVSDGEKLTLESDISIQAIFTPGHNPSCITWLAEDKIFTGDSYIPGLKTVTNLPKADKVQALASEELILRLSQGRTILPGHKVHLESDGQ